MKKINYLFFAILAISVSFLTVSCKSDQDATGAKTDYAKALVGNFEITSSQTGGMLQVKAANGMQKTQGVSGNVYEVYKAVPGAIPFALVDGSEFLPGSAPALDWAQPNCNPIWFDSNSAMHVTYCPILPLRFVAKSTVGAKGTQYSYLGIADITPTAQSFPLSIQSKRLGDKLIVNVDALRNLPGYTNLTFKVSYTKSIIDVDQTALLSGDTKNGWPTYTYSSTVSVVDQVISGSGDVVVYEGYDAKITGDVTIKIFVDGVQIAKATPSLAVGKALKVKLTTSKVGWYDSGILCISYQDIVTETVSIDI